MISVQRALPLRVPWRDTLYSHRKHALFVCHHKNCRRSYFSNDELLKHVKVHKGMVWSCPEKNCDYTTYDKWLLKPHSRKHSDEKPYICGLCGKGHHYHIQYVCIMSRTMSVRRHSQSNIVTFYLKHFFYPCTRTHHESEKHLQH